MRVAGLDRTTWDVAVRVPAALRRRANRAEPAPDRLSRYGPVSWSPGGAVSLLLAAMAWRQHPARRDLDLCWLGVTAPMDLPAEPLAAPLDGLRRLGVVPVSLARAVRHGRRVHLVDDVTGVVAGGRRVDPPEPAVLDPAAPDLGGWPEPDLLVVSTRELALLTGLPEAAAVAVLAEPGTATDATAGVRALAAAGRLRWLLGTDAGLARVAGVPLDGVEVVRVPDPVGPGPPGGSELGVAEAYAGSYLYDRLLDAEPAAAHGNAVAFAARVGAEPGGCLPPDDDLNTLFAALIDRTSERADEGRLFDRFRQAAGFVLMSGGQTGVGQLALEAAGRLGVPAFCVLPAGRRTETTEGLWPGPDRFGAAHVEVLATPKYRYRTWASVYLADATLLWDFHASEGCGTARDACQVLGRPYLDLAPLTDPEERRRRLWELVSRHDVRVVNIEGNRGTLLTAAETAIAAEHLDELLRMLPARLRSVVPAVPAARVSPPAADATRTAVTIGAPSVPGQRRLVEAFLAQAYGLEPVPDRVLTASYPVAGIDLVFIRPRDLPVLLRDGALDLALCGSDLLDPAAGHGVLLDTGLSALLQVLVGRAGNGVRPLADELAKAVVGSQDVALARRLLRAACGYRGPIRRIEGTAETWIALGLIDLAVDTWSTGATAQVNRLVPLHVLGHSSLVVAARSGQDLPARAERLVADLGAWLRQD